MRPSGAAPNAAGRGPAPSRTRNEIAGAAIAIADAEGIEAVTMRRLANQLGIGTTSLYGYVRGKEELYDLMLDSVAAEHNIGSPPNGDWRSVVCAYAQQLRRSMHRHPWTATLAAARPSMGPNSLAVAERTLAALDGLGLHVDEMMAIVATVAAYVRGHTVTELAEEEARRRSGLDLPQWMQAQAPYIQTIIVSDEYPLMTKVMFDGTNQHDSGGSDKQFDFGLDRLLDGLSAALPRPRKRRG